MRARAVPWTADHDRLMAVSAGRDLPIIREEVRRGIATLWACEQDGELLAHVVTRIDGVKGLNQELVIVLGEGRGFFAVVPMFLRLAERDGLPVRVHVQRRGLIRMFDRLGVSLDHYVLRGLHDSRH